MKILRMHQTLERTGYTRSPLYSKVAAGLFPQPVKLGRRAAGWLEHEVDAVLVARAAGATETELMQLVSDLHSRRQLRLRKLTEGTSEHIEETAGPAVLS